MFCAEWRAVDAMTTAEATRGIGRRPGERLHPAHRPADHGIKSPDTQMIEQHRLRAYHVADGDDGKAHRKVGWPSAAADLGPEEPMQLPMTLGQTTKKRLVSTGQPGPTIRVHQPGLPVMGWFEATCWSPVSA